MATQKRRIVYFSDQEWDKIGEEARLTGQSISSYLRHAASLAWMETRKAEVEFAARAPSFHATPILRREERAMQEFRPVPKPSRK